MSALSTSSSTESFVEIDAPEASEAWSTNHANSRDSWIAKSKKRLSGHGRRGSERASLSESITTGKSLDQSFYGHQSVSSPIQPPRFDESRLPPGTHIG